MFHPSEVCFQDLNTGEIFCVPVETVQSIAREDADYPSYDQPVPPDGWVPPPWKDPFSDHTHPPAGDH